MQNMFINLSQLNWILNLIEFGLFNINTAGELYFMLVHFVAIHN